MAHTPFYRHVSGFLAFLMVFESVALAGGPGPRRLPTVRDLEAYQKQQRLEHERRQARQQELEEEANARHTVQNTLNVTLFQGLPVGEHSENMLLARQGALAANLELNDSVAYHRMIFRLLGQTLAAALHHPARVAYAHGSAASARASGTVSQGPFRTAGEEPSATPYSGEDLDTRATQTATTAQLQASLSTRPTPFRSGFLADVRMWGARALILLGITAAGLWTVTAFSSVSAGRGGDWEETRTTESTTHLLNAPRTDYGSDIVVQIGADNRSNVLLGDALGAYEKAWTEAIDTSPVWARAGLRSRVLESSDYLAIQQLEREIHDTNEALTRAEGTGEAESLFDKNLALMVQANARHLKIVMGLRHWLGIPHRSDTHFSNRWGEENNLQMDAFEEQASGFDKWYVTLWGYNLAFAALGFGLFTAASLARLAVGNHREKRESEALKQKLLDKLAEGYSDGCQQIGVTPSPEVLQALRSGRMDLSLAIVTQGGSATACESALNKVGALNALGESTQPGPAIAARVEETTQDEAGEALERDASADTSRQQNW